MQVLEQPVGQLTVKKNTLVLSCVKTGRWWPVATYKAARGMASRLGLKDYEVGRAE